MIGWSVHGTTPDWHQHRGKSSSGKRFSRLRLMTRLFRIGFAIPVLLWGLSCTRSPDEVATRRPGLSSAATQPVTGRKIFGEIGDARSVCYVLCVTGSSIGYLALLKTEVDRDIAGLPEDRQFNLIFASSNPVPDALSRTGLVPASEINKRKASRFLDDVCVSGPVDPAGALSFALKQQPDQIYFVNDSDDVRDPDQYANRLQGAARRSRITAIVFDGGASDPQLMAALHRVADSSGGSVRCVRVSDLE